MSRAANKSDRLLKIEAFLLAHPEGISQAEIARRLGVNRSIISRDIPDLPSHIYIDDLDGKRLKIDREAYLVNVRLTLNEALAMHLATRMLATRTDRHNPHAASALRKLGISLENLAPQISSHMLNSADQMDNPLWRRQDPVYLQALERLTLAWAEKRMVHIWHRHEDGKVTEYDFAPYFIEPYAIGQSTHVIGLREPPGALRTFKIERLERVELLRKSYLIPQDFSPHELLSDAWGIWFTEEEPVKVVLRFSQNVVRRVLETRWHHSEEIENQPDGKIIWRAFIAAPQEMLPWIRGWGADVEVIEPENLRNILLDEVAKMATVYKTSTK